MPYDSLKTTVSELLDIDFSKSKLSKKLSIAAHPVSFFATDNFFICLFYAALCSAISSTAFNIFSVKMAENENICICAASYKYSIDKQLNV